MCRLPNEPYQFGETPSRPLSEAQKLRKVIMELLETERAYVKVILIYFEIVEFVSKNASSMIN